MSPRNTIGPIGMGLAQAYSQTADSAHLAALQDAGALLLTKVYNFSPSDGYRAAKLDAVFGVSTYTNHVKTNFYDKLAAGTYNRNNAGTLYSTATYVQLIRTSRSGSQANMAAWDIGMGLVGAAAAGADTTEWIAGVKAEINELNGDGWYDVIGLAGAIYVAVLAILAIAADCVSKVPPPPITISSTLNCQPSLYGPTYWMEFPGCSEAEKLLIESDKLPRDCSLEGEIITATGVISLSNGDYVLVAWELDDCFPLLGVDTCQ